MLVEKSRSRNSNAVASLGFVASFAPGLAVAGGLAWASAEIEHLTTRIAFATVGIKMTITAPVIALLIGMVLHPFTDRPTFTVGTTFAIKKILRWAIALFGLKIALADIVGLGLGTAVMVIVAMAVTLGSGVLFARIFGRRSPRSNRRRSGGGLRRLRRAGDGVRRAPLQGSRIGHGFRRHHRQYPRDGGDDRSRSARSSVSVRARPGIFLGATIHDVAQVVGAGYAVSDETGNIATIVKLFRVFMLLPVVLGVGWWFSSQGGDSHKARVPIPVFAIMFLASVIINTAGILPPPLKFGLIEASRWGLLIAIASLGLNTSLGTILRVGPRHMLVVLGSSAVIFVIPLLWLLAVQ